MENNNFYEEKNHCLRKINPFWDPTKDDNRQEPAFLSVQNVESKASNSLDITFKKTIGLGDITVTVHEGDLVYLTDKNQNSYITKIKKINIIRSAYESDFSIVLSDPAIFIDNKLKHSKEDITILSEDIRYIYVIESLNDSFYTVMCDVPREIFKNSKVNSVVCVNRSLNFGSYSTQLCINDHGYFYINIPKNMIDGVYDIIYMHNPLNDDNIVSHTLGHILVCQKFDIFVFYTSKYNDIDIDNGPNQYNLLNRYKFNNDEGEYEVFKNYYYTSPHVISFFTSYFNDTDNSIYNNKIQFKNDLIDCSFDINIANNSYFEFFNVPANCKCYISDDIEKYNVGISTDTRSFKLSNKYNNELILWGSRYNYNCRNFKVDIKNIFMYFKDIGFKELGKNDRIKITYELISNNRIQLKNVISIAGIYSSINNEHNIKGDFSFIIPDCKPGDEYKITVGLDSHDYTDGSEEYDTILKSEFIVPINDDNAVTLDMITVEHRFLYSFTFDEYHSDMPAPIINIWELLSDKMRSDINSNPDNLVFVKLKRSDGENYSIDNKPLYLAPGDYTITISDIDKATDREYLYYYDFYIFENGQSDIVPGLFKKKVIDLNDKNQDEVADKYSKTILRLLFFYNHDYESGWSEDVSPYIESDIIVKFDYMDTDVENNKIILNGDTIIKTASLQSESDFANQINNHVIDIDITDKLSDMAMIKIIAAVKNNIAGDTTYYEQKSVLNISDNAIGDEVSEYENSKVYFENDCRIWRLSFYLKK